MHSTHANRRVPGIETTSIKETNMDPIANNVGEDMDSTGENDEILGENEY